MNILSRLRAWLRPYPDDAEMQRAMLLRVDLIRAGNNPWAAIVMRFERELRTRGYAYSIPDAFRKMS